MKSITLKKIVSSRIITNLIIISVLMIIFSILSPFFFSVSNIVNIGMQSAITIMVSFGMTFVILTGGIDLSVGAVVSLCSVIAVYLLGLGAPIIAVIAAVIIIGLLFGTFHGFMVAKTSVHPFLVTLGTMSIARGIGYIITDGSTLPLLNKEFLNIFTSELFGVIPISVVCVIITLAICIFILKKLKIGREVYAVGSNKLAARLSGINVTKVLMFTYIFSGILVGFTSLLVAARVSSGIPSYGEGLEVECIVAVVMGGTSFNGGRGSAVGTLIGALLIVILINGLTLLGVSYYIQMVIKGIVIIIAVYLDTIGKAKN